MKKFSQKDEAKHSKGILYLDMSFIAVSVVILIACVALIFSASKFTTNIKPVIIACILPIVTGVACLVHSLSLFFTDKKIIQSKKQDGKKINNK